MDYLSWGFISQVGIFIFGASAIILVARKNRWGFVMGLLSQPFWFISSFQARQWEFLLLALFMPLVGFMEFTNGFLRKMKKLSSDTFKIFIIRLFFKK